MTYSIIGRDLESGEVGAAVQSKFPGVGTIVLHGCAEAGCITTQAFANPRHGEVGLQLLKLGASPEQALSILLRGDDKLDQRQIAILGLSGVPAAFTGSDVQAWDGWSGAHKGAHCVASGNTLSSNQVVVDMVHCFETTCGDMADRLVAALKAGRDAGGELRGEQSAALLVVKPGGGYGGWSGRHVDISVYDHPEPIEELQRCYRLHRLSYFPSDLDKLIEINPQIARELKDIMRVAGFRDFPDTSQWDTDEISALERFMGVENYDNRLRTDAFIDREVLEDLRGRYKKDN
jgi:uncharacterized Ntn-hydrolase superfamily protein